MRHEPDWETDPVPVSVGLSALGGLYDRAQAHRDLAKVADQVVLRHRAMEYIKEAYVRDLPADEVVANLMDMGFDKEAAGSLILGAAKLMGKMVPKIVSGGAKLVKGTGRLMGFGGPKMAPHKSFRLTRKLKTPKVKPGTPKPDLPKPPPAPPKPKTTTGKMWQAAERGAQDALSPGMIGGTVILGGGITALGEKGVVGRAKGFVRGAGESIGIKHGPGVYKTQPMM